MTVTPDDILFEDSPWTIRRGLNRPRLFHHHETGEECRVYTGGRGTSWKGDRIAACMKCTVQPPQSIIGMIKLIEWER